MQDAAHPQEREANLRRTAPVATGAAQSPGDSAHVAPHVPLRVLIATIVALLVLTALTVAATAVDLGRGNLWIALVIATAKASLVALYFMHLRYDKPFNAIVLIAALAFVTLFVGLALMDTLHYRSDIQIYLEKNPSHAAPDLERS